MITSKLFSVGSTEQGPYKDFIEAFPAREWDVPEEFKLMNSTLKATPRKIVAHVLLLKSAIGAQIATLLRLSGVTNDFHDFLFSPTMGGELRRQQDQG